MISMPWKVFVCKKMPDDSIFPQSDAVDNIVQFCAAT